MKLPVGYVPGHGVVKASGFGGYGQRMLERMGWEKGQGLGRDKSGMKDAIEVKKKEDTRGVGASHSGWDWNLKYWDEAYNSAVKKVNHETDSSSSSSQSDSGSSSGSDSDSSSDDEEPALKRGRGAAGSAGHNVNRDGTVSSATAEERRINAELAKDAWGRWGGRKGKMARIREQEEAQAAAMRASLGLPPAAAAGTRAGASSESDSDAEACVAARRDSGHGVGPSACSGSGSAAAAGEAPSKKKPLVVVLQIKDDPLRKAFTFAPTPSTGWWGAKYFRSVGPMVSMEDEAEGERAERRTFDEGDQEALYMRLHGTQRVGRRGMGKSDTLKIAGGKWEGSKVMFEEDGGGSGGDGSKAAAGHAAAARGSDVDADDNSAQAPKKAKDKKNRKDKKRAKDEKDKDGGKTRGRAVPGVDDACVSAGEATRKGKKKEKNGTKTRSSAGGDDVAAAGGGAAPCRKWIRVARRLLKKAPERRLRARALMAALREYGVGSARPVVSPGSKAALRETLRGDAKARLAIEGKYVVLQQR